MGEFTHFNQQGDAVMVDVSEKDITSRVATAQGEIHVCPEIMEAIQGGTAKKGDVLGIARVAGIMATKKTSDMIPLCHPLALTKVTIDFHLEPEKGIIQCQCTAKVQGKTGVEMEALTGVSICLLTIYDMCKAIDKSMEISNIHLVHKAGGKSGEFFREEN